MKDGIRWCFWFFGVFSVFSVYAVNPVSKEYVDEKIAILQAEINAIINAGN